MAAFNENVKENEAWLSFTFHFLSKKLPVPEIYAWDEQKKYFIIQDLGDKTLFDHLSEISEDEKLFWLKKTLLYLIDFQAEGIKGLDLNMAYPVREFDLKSALWDLNYFKYYFVKTHELPFNESLLDSDFEHFAKTLLQAGTDFFQYRDFQARNCMVFENELYFIDFQGGRKGPVQYDLVSLLFQAKAMLGKDLREKLINFYISQLELKIPGIGKSFFEFFPIFVYFRMMQVFGAYGFRGLLQKKSHFIQSIPFAIQNLKSVLQEYPFPPGYGELEQILKQIVRLENRYSKNSMKNQTLTIEINSFSYKQTSYPEDQSGNGGGFVFDCRSLPNPYKIPELRKFSGLDNPVIEFFKSHYNLESFLNPVFKLADQSIENYLSRQFNDLQINFGCTGGKHRSVFCAERLKSYLEMKYAGKINVCVKHTARNDW